jgi:hypothetical protein
VPAREHRIDLWRISDNVSALFMQRFYANLADGDAAGDALRSALGSRTPAQPWPSGTGPLMLNGTQARARRGPSPLGLGALICGSRLPGVSGTAIGNPQLTLHLGTRHERRQFAGSGVRQKWNELQRFRPPPAFAPAGSWRPLAEFARSFVRS